MQEWIEEQARRAGRRGWRESRSAARLAAVWAERDAEIDERIGRAPPMSYRFTCRHCGSKFSLEQQLDEHEAECGRVGAAEKASAKSQLKSIPCKRCRAAGIDVRFPSIAEQMKHVRAEHLEDFQTKHSAGIRRRRAELKKIDDAVGSNPHDAGAAPPTEQKTSPARPLSAQGDGRTCPTCGGPVPKATAQLVKELTEAGIPEPQAFEAARIARRILGVGQGAT